MSKNLNCCCCGAEVAGSICPICGADPGGLVPEPKEKKMNTLPNGLKVFNGTPHVIRFWREGWDNPVGVSPDEAINASITEERVARPSTVSDNALFQEPMFVTTKFEATEDGKTIIERAIKNGADVIVGSIIAAQAYPGKVVAMTPAPGYERVPPAKKRMNPDKFTVF